MSRMMRDTAYDRIEKNSNQLPQLFRTLPPLHTAVYLHPMYERSHTTDGRLRCRLRICRLVADAKRMMTACLHSAFSGCRVIVCFACWSYIVEVRGVVCQSHSNLEVPDERQLEDIWQTLAGTLHNSTLSGYS